MIILIIIYVIILLWLFNLEKQRNLEIEEENTDIDIVINNVTSIKNLLITIDSIQNNNYPLHKIKLFIFERTSDDLVSILDLYAKKFASIKIFKINKFNESEYFNELDNNLFESPLIFLCSSGSTIHKNLFIKGIYYINNLDISILFLPEIIYAKNRLESYFQISRIFQNSLFASLINKKINNKINLYINSLIIKNDCFYELIVDEKSIKNYNQKYILDNKLIINFSTKKKSVLTQSYFFNILDYTVNLLYIFSITGFLLYPSFYFLGVIILKIIPELCYVYSFYNQLNIKFPKAEFLLYSIINPFYIFINLLPKKLIK